MNKLLVSFLILQLCIFKLLASPAFPDTIEFKQPDGNKISILLKGDEHLKWAETTDGFTILFNKKGFYEYAELNEDGDMVCSGFIARNIRERLRDEKEFLSKVSKGLSFSEKQRSYSRSLKQMLKSQTAVNAFPTKGNLKLLCILMDYSDQPFTKTQSDFYNLFNQLNYSADNARGSVRDFYIENSYNQLNLSITVVGPYRADNVMAYYGANDGDGDDINPKALITEAVQKANPDVNYADFDNDDDGYVDGVYVIYAGYGEEAGAPDDAIWAHAWSITATLLDGKYIKKYSCSPELRSNSGTGITRIGVICHEFGHVLGAPDFYDIDGTTGGKFDGTGKWDLMAGGNWNNSGVSPAHHNGYTKTHLYNWASATVLTSPTSLTLQNSAQDANSFYEYSTQTTGEYFFCENRQQIGFDSYIPGHGLIIYHVHKDVGTGSINITHPQKFYPVCANAATEPGSDPVLYGVINSGACLYPGTSGKTSFTDATIPSSKSWAGEFTNKPVTNISENITDKTIAFDFMGGYADNPQNLTGTPISTAQINLTWTQNATYTTVMVAYNTSSTFGTPVDGSSYIAGNTISGGGTVLYKGTLENFSHTGLNPGTKYYYKVWSVKPGNIYSIGITNSATTYTSDFTWTGNVSNDWSTAGNWSGNSVPPSGNPIIIPSGCTYYPVVNESISCISVNINNGASLTVTTGANITVADSIKVGQGTSGSFSINGGTCSVNGKLYTEAGTIINVSGGTLNIGGWERNLASTWAKGTINLTGGTINANGNVYFSNSGVTGSMSGNLIINAGASFYINSNGFTNVTGGTINLTGSTGTAPFFYIPSSASYGTVAFHLNVNAPGKTYYLCRSNGTLSCNIKGNLNILSGVADLTNGSYAVSDFNVSGNISIGASGTLNCANNIDANINLEGNWSNEGTFNAGSNTLTLAGTNQTISGINTFYNLVKNVTSAASLTFAPGSQNKTTIGGTMNFSGVPGQRLSLRSSTPGLQCHIDPQGTRTVSCLDVRDSYNVNTTAIYAIGTNSISTGNNTNWNFGPTSVPEIETAGNEMFKLFPNPANNTLHILFSSQTSRTIDIISMEGKILITQPVFALENKIDVSSLPAGTYIIKIIYSESVYTRQFLKL